MPDYGNKLKQIRKELSLTQEEFAQKLQMSYRTYTAYERNENKPPLNMLDMLNINFNVNLNWFISNKGAMFNKDEFKNSTCIMFEKIEKLIDKKFKEKGL